MPSYLDIFFPKRYIIAGVTLKPLSLGHLLFFENYNVDYRISHIDKRKPEENEAVIWNSVLLLLICSRNWEENHQLNDLYLFNKDKWRPVYDKVRDGLLKCNVADEYAALMAYLVGHLQNIPKTYKNKDQERYSPSDQLLGSPELLSLATAIISKYNDSVARIFRVDTIMDLPFDAIMWINANRAEMEGLTTIEPTDDPEYQEIFKRVDRYTSIADPDERFRVFMSGSLDTP